MATYYVRDSSAGVDTPLGGTSTSNPWKTLAYAFPRLVAGDILYLLGNQGEVNFKWPTISRTTGYKDGTAAAPIRIVRHTSATFIMDKDGNHANLNGGVSNIIINKINYWYFENFKVRWLGNPAVSGSGVRWQIAGQFGGSGPQGTAADATLGCKWINWDVQNLTMWVNGYFNCGFQIDCEWINCNFFNIRPRVADGGDAMAIFPNGAGYKVLNCKFRDIGSDAIQRGNEGAGTVYNALIENCVFENTRPYVYYNEQGVASGTQFNNVGENYLDFKGSGNTGLTIVRKCKFGVVGPGVGGLRGGVAGQDPSQANGVAIVTHFYPGNLLIDQCEFGDNKTHIQTGGTGQNTIVQNSKFWPLGGLVSSSTNNAAHFWLNSMSGTLTLLNNTLYESRAGNDFIDTGTNGWTGLFTCKNNAFIGGQFDINTTAINNSISHNAYQNVLNKPSWMNGTGDRTQSDIGIDLTTLAPKQNSICINNGTPNSLTVDFNGQQRPLGIVDIGAVEYGSTAPEGTPLQYTSSGTLPAGVSFNATTCVYSGTPTEVGSFAITTTASNNYNGTANSVSDQWILEVSEPATTFKRYLFPLNEEPGSVVFQNLDPNTGSSFNGTWNADNKTYIEPNYTRTYAISEGEGSVLADSGLGYVDAVIQSSTDPELGWGTASRWTNVYTFGVGGGGGATDLSTTVAPTQVVINSNTGADATIPAATNVNAGVMTAADRIKLDAITGTNTGNVSVSDTATIDLTLTGQALTAAVVANSIGAAQLDATVDASLAKADTAVQTVAGTAPITSSGTVDKTIGITAASGAAAGSMSAAHWTKLEGIEAGATADQTAAEISIADAGNLYTANTVEAALAEVKTIADANTSINKFATVADMVAYVGASAGDRAEVQNYSATALSGLLNFIAVASNTGTADFGSFINGQSIQWKQIFPADAVSVESFGAPNGSTDDTARIQAAINYVDGLDRGATNMGGVVTISSVVKPQSTITVKGGVTLKGSMEHCGGFKDTYPTDLQGGAVECFTGSTTAFTVEANSCIKGLRIHKTGTDYTQTAVNADGWLGTAIAGDGSGIGVKDCIITGFLRGIDLGQGGTTARARIDNVYIDCVHGLRIKDSVDVDRISNVHVHPALSLVAESHRDGIGIELTATDSSAGSWARLENCFVFAHDVGFKLHNAINIAMNDCGIDAGTASSVESWKGVYITGDSRAIKINNMDFGGSYDIGIHCDVTAGGAGLPYNTLQVSNSKFFGGDAFHHVYIANLGKYTSTGNQYTGGARGITMAANVACTLSLSGNMFNAQTLSPIANLTASWSNPVWLLDNSNSIAIASTTISTWENSVEKVVSRAAATTTFLDPDSNLFSLTGTTAISGFYGSWPGRVVVIKAVSGFTINASASIVLQTGTARVLAAGDTITFMCAGVSWYEISGGMRDIVKDTSPTLGGDLDGGGFKITNVSRIENTGGWAGSQQDITLAGTATTTISTGNYDLIMLNGTLSGNPTLVLPSAATYPNQKITIYNNCVVGTNKVILDGAVGQSFFQLLVPNHNDNGLSQIIAKGEIITLQGIANPANGNKHWLVINRMMFPPSWYHKTSTTTPTQLMHHERNVTIDAGSTATTYRLPTYWECYGMGEFIIKNVSASATITIDNATGDGASFFGVTTTGQATDTLAAGETGRYLAMELIDTAGLGSGWAVLKSQVIV